MHCCDLSAKLSLDAGIHNLSLESTLLELPLWELQLESSDLGCVLANQFQANPLLPGVILVKKGEFVGMISRRRFLEYISLPHGLGTFTHSSLQDLYEVLPSDILILPGETLILVAVRQSLERNLESLYEPIVVKTGTQQYGLVDVYQLLVAESLIHELTTKLLREQNRTQLVQTDKLTTLGRMVTEIAHEIRNPVNCIQSNLPFLLQYFQELRELVLAYESEYPDSSPMIQEIKNKIDLDFILTDLQQVLKSTNLSSVRLKQIIGSLRNFSPRSEQKRQLFDIHECIDSTLLILNNLIYEDIAIIKNYGDLPLIHGYVGLLNQVFMNLLTNAIDALADKKTTSKDGQPRIEITTKIIEQANSQWVVIIIADNGVGMPPEIQKQIFEYFFTTKPVGKGTGLGLAISYEIVTKKHNGQLQVTSQLGVGTKFQILLPLVS
jgi:signal transduction histidine kinase